MEAGHRWGRRVGASALGAGLLLVSMATPAFAAHGRPGGGGGGGRGAGTTGNDISYPQCGTSFPSAPAFGIVGLNGGLANDLNQCFGPPGNYPAYLQSELYWELSESTGAVAVQPKASIYVNTADPGNVYNGTVITDWPTTSNSEDPYGTCTTTTVDSTTVGENSNACAWQYGYDKATQDVAWLAQEAAAVAAQESSVPVPTQAGSYPWWLDVETANTWQTGSSGQQMNVADLQGMMAGLQAAGAGAPGQVGVYSTSYQWGQITGTPGATTDGIPNSLWGTPDWVPGARTESGAAGNCSAAPFTGGSVTLTQWVSRGLDGDYVCP
jgi:hypothetical protein